MHRLNRCFWSGRIALDRFDHVDRHCTAASFCLFAMAGGNTAGFDVVLSLRRDICWSDERPGYAEQYVFSDQQFLCGFLPVCRMGKSCPLVGDDQFYVAAWYRAWGHTSFSVAQGNISRLTGSTNKNSRLDVCCFFTCWWLCN